MNGNDSVYIRCSYYFALLLTFGIAAASTMNYLQDVDIDPVVSRSCVNFSCLLVKGKLLLQVRAGGEGSA